MFDNFQKNFGVILAFLAALFALLFFWTYQVYSLNANDQWEELDKRFNSGEPSTERLMSLAGFHGLVYNFQSYLIHSNPENKNAFFTYFKEARDELQSLRDHFGARADVPVRTIDETLRNYFVSINRIDQLRGQGKSIREIDETINIDNKAAFDAYRTILDLYTEEENRLQGAVLSSMEKNQSNLNSLYTTLFAIGLLLIIGIVMGLRFEFLKRKAAAREKETKSVLEDFLDSSIVPFLVTGTDDIIRHCNRAAAGLLDTNPRNLVGASLRQVLEFGKTLPADESPFGEKRNVRVPATLHLTDGNEIPVQADFSMNKEGTMRTIALFDMREELRNRERILLEAEQKLANVTIDGSLAVRRDIQKFIELVEEFQNSPNGTHKEFAERAGKIAASMKDHAADYHALSWAHLENDSYFDLKAPLCRPIGETVSETLKKFEGTIAERDLTFNWINRISKKERVDFPVQLQSIVKNLVSNAVNYTPKSGAVKVSTLVEKGALLVKVEDTGIGIAEEDVPKIFERGLRLEKAAAMSGGLGIGLYTVRETVNNLGGEISCTSYAGIGSDFLVRIPLGKTGNSDEGEEDTEDESKTALKAG
ncbi:MAG: hypothetical protein EP348_01995 [Alphaproteobacteria bacterium]|nr:MAG: hypothetical protein EP348_01995 [Alphaproteobacteria bacterium]